MIRINFNYLIAFLVPFMISSCTTPTAKNKGDNKKHLKNVNEYIFRDLYGHYFFDYQHYTIGSGAETKYEPILDINGDTISDLDIVSLKSFSDFYVDKKYYYKITNRYNHFEIVANSIDSISKGCYFEKSNYVIKDNAIFFYYHGNIVNTNENIDCSCGEVGYYSIYKFNRETDTFHVLNTEDNHNDYAILNDKIFINGCKLKHESILNSEEFKKIKNRIEKKDYKIEYCY